jgi:apolipoprotein N-acyltransferase
MPGYSLSPLIFIAFVPLFFALYRESEYTYVKVLLFSLIFYMVSLIWLLTTISYYGSAPIYVSIIILFIFSLYLSIYWLLFIYFYKKISNKIVLTTVFVALEILRGTLLTGFPWLNLAQSQFNNIYILKITSIVGEYGLTFIIFITNLFLTDYFAKGKLKPLFIGISIPTITFIFGYILIQLDKPINEQLRVTVIQPAYEQKVKWDEEYSNKIIESNIDLINKAIREKTELLILPEAVFPVFLDLQKSLYSYLIDISYVKPIVFGNIRRDLIKNKYFNSVFYINEGHVNTYDKIHLVPFGEYFPLQKLFKPIKYYFFGDSEAFSSGHRIITFVINNFNFAALICYECAYTQLIQKFMKKDPDFLIINTNDSWFGNSIGRFQHLAIAILRASESSKYVVRSAQSGISACIDSDGRVLNYLNINEAGHFNCTILKSHRSSIFNKFQYTWFVILILIIAYYYFKSFIDKKKIAKKEN